MTTFAYSLETRKYETKCWINHCVCQLILVIITLCIGQHLTNA